MSKILMLQACSNNEKNSWVWADWQHVQSALQRSGNIGGAITEARCYSFNLPQGGLEVLCTLHFSGDAKLGRFYKLGTSKNINIDKI